MSYKIIALASLRIIYSINSKSICGYYEYSVSDRNSAYKKSNLIVEWAQIDATPGQIAEIIISDQPTLHPALIATFIDFV